MKKYSIIAVGDIMNILEETKYIMNKYKVKANKNLGQNFLIDEQAIKDIVEGAQITSEDLVIEIGPGLGTLTAFLLEKAKKVICIELDKKMIKILNDRFIAYDNIELINEDVLRINLNEIIKQEKESNNIKNVKIVANLPYYITTPIIMKLIESKLDIESITVMIQKEVADRLIEIPSGKNTGAITYTIYYYCQGEKIREVENTSFIPMPEVTSEVINLKLRNEPVVKVENEKVFFNIIKSSFMQRRKTLINALVNAGVFINKEEGQEFLEQANLNENIRAENLTIEDFASLCNIFCNKYYKK